MIVNAAVQDRQHLDKVPKLSRYRCKGLVVAPIVVVAAAIVVVVAVVVVGTTSAPAAPTSSSTSSTTTASSASTTSTTTAATSTTSPLRVQGDGTKGFGIQGAFLRSSKTIVNSRLFVQGIAGNRIKEVVLFVGHGAIGGITGLVVFGSILLLGKFCQFRLEVKFFLWRFWACKQKD